MFKKKKITKKSLDELAKVMPILHEYEMRLMVGGVEFRDLSGTLISTIGSSKEVRYVDPMNSNTMDAIDNLQSESAASSIGRSWDNISSVIKTDIIANMISRSGNGRYSKLLTQTVTYGSLDQGLVMGVIEGSRLVINSNQVHNFTYAELQSILDHEENHLIDNPSGTGLAVSENENDAYSGQVASSYFKGQSEWFRILTARSWYANTRGKYSKSQIASMCGVKEWKF